MRKSVMRFACDDSGSATMEYSLIAAGLSAAIITMLQGIGLRLAANVSETRTALR